MKYSEIYDFYCYLRKNDVELTPEMREFALSQDTIDKDDYPIFAKWSLPVVKEYLNERDYGVRKFLKECVKDVTDEQIIEYMKIIAGKGNYSQQEQLIKACYIEYIRKHKEVFKIIAEKDKKQQEQIIKACDNEYIRKNMRVLKTIIGKDDYRQQEQLREAYDNAYIRKHWDVFEMIAGKDNHRLQRQLRIAYGNKYIRDDKEIMDLIIKEDNPEKLEQLIKACDDSEYIREHKNIFKKIAGESDDRKRDLLVRIYKNEYIRENKEILDIILNESDANKQKQLCFAYSNRIVREDREFFDVIVNQDDYEKQEQLVNFFDKLMHNGGYIAPVVERYYYSSDEDYRAAQIKVLKKYLSIIVSEDDLKKREQLILAYGEIRLEKINDKLFQLIAKQDTWQMMELLTKTCTSIQYRCLIEDEEVLDLISSQDSFEKQKLVIKACTNPIIRTNKEILRLISSQDNLEKQKEMIEICDKEETRRYVRNSIQGQLQQDEYLLHQLQVVADDFIPDIEEKQMQEMLDTSLDDTTAYIKAYEQISDNFNKCSFPAPKIFSKEYRCKPRLIKK